MHFSTLLLPLMVLATVSGTETKDCNVSSCYASPLPPLSPLSLTTSRPTPWGKPAFTLPNGTLCCDSLTQVRAGINAIDAQLVELLAQRAAFVREATRFKRTIDSIDVPARDREVIEGAVNASRKTEPRLPETIARAVFEAIINASVPFEECVFGESEAGCGEE
ncbi:uncharacterized protein RAG0_09853 [Rhynchosporium agropyri]|uniref:Chorismate mutase domain-containing protein n=1 Tax=Rhynchosporium agropyri TaxID=914238 RepID=A0A1E1KXA3_9HELO|nr:uncharacterized protein RAG0_09853 [Rhynchosporium agropyri]